MQHHIFAVLPAEARRRCAETLDPSFPGAGTIATQPLFAPIRRRDLMTAVNLAAHDLGLKPTTVLVLDALLSCLPCRAASGAEIPIGPETLLTVYAANETLCFRAKGLTDRQLRRHLRTLEAAGLIRRRDSANGKRFPIKRAGKVVGAFGIDLSPLLVRSSEILVQAKRRTHEVEELRGLKAQILQLRAACLRLRLSETIRRFIEPLRNLARRASLGLVEARSVLEELRAVLRGTPPDDAPSSDTEAGIDPADALACPPAPGTPARISRQPIESPPRTDRMSGTKRHKTHNQEKIRNRSAPDAPWTSLTAVSAFYPVPPATPRDAQIIAYEFGRMLTLGPELITDAIARLGLWHVLKVQDRIAQGIDRIRNPEAYLRRILAQVVPVENARRISPMKDRSAQPSSEYPVCRASVP